MLTGLPPWYSEDRHKMYEGIKAGALQFPPDMSPQAVDVLTKFLSRNAKERLGSQGGILQVKQHSFFSDVDWQAMLNRSIEAPFKPNLQHDLDTGNFETDFTKLPINSVRESSHLDNNPPPNFAGFTYDDNANARKFLTARSLTRTGFSQASYRNSPQNMRSPATPPYTGVYTKR